MQQLLELPQPLRSEGSTAVSNHVGGGRLIWFFQGPMSMPIFKEQVAPIPHFLLTKIQPFIIGSSRYSMNINTCALFLFYYINSLCTTACYFP